MCKALQLATLRSEPIPAGCYLVHNHVRPMAPLGHNGFRAWLQTRSDNLVECDCNFGGCKNSKVHEVHYCVVRGDPDRVRDKPMKKAPLRKVRVPVVTLYHFTELEKVEAIQRNGLLAYQQQGEGSPVGTGPSVVYLTATPNGR
jgi:hypothetical protein